MWLRLLRHGLLACLLAVLGSVLVPRPAHLYADANAGACRTTADADSYYYSDGSHNFYIFNTGNGTFPTVEDCWTYSQGHAIYWAGASCTGVSRGTYGVLYAVVSWKVWWNDDDQTPDGPVVQQYDCGDVSIY